MNRAKKFFIEKALQFFSEPLPFEQWLKSKPLDEVVGYAKSLCDCPLAIFSKYLGFPVVEVTVGHMDILVGSREVTPFGTSKEGYTEDGVLDTEDAIWWWDFVNMIDDHHNQGNPITASRALAVLACSRLYNASGTIEDIENMEERILRGLPLLKTALELTPGDRIELGFMEEGQTTTVVSSKQETVERQYASGPVVEPVVLAECLLPSGNKHSARTTGSTTGPLAYWRSTVSCFDETTVVVCPSSIKPSSIRSPGV